MIAVIGQDGWQDPATPPDNDAVVQLAWDDMSYGDNSYGFYDGVAVIPESNRKFWWSWSPTAGPRRLPDGHVGAWRDRP